MADEPESHTIRLLRELRDEMRVEFAMIAKRFEKVDERFDDDAACGSTGSRTC